jgi:hypothetical protein
MNPRSVAEAGYDGLLVGERVVVPGFENKAAISSRRFLSRETFVRMAEDAQNGYGTGGECRAGISPYDRRRRPTRRPAPTPR